MYKVFVHDFVEMMGLIGMGNNPMVGCTVAVAVAVEEGMNK
ncbi:GGGtGRT protein [Clostridium botulinum]|nr:GGGtGRT protein [Clostridium botulinum]MBY7022086.1 GGGtGRT protein [Clostridium botulinum]